MYTEFEQDEQSLQSQLDGEQSKLDALLRDLAAIDGELEALSTEREQYALLGEACGALEKLDQIGGSKLFWGDRPADGNGDVHVATVRRQISDFARRVGDIETSRQSVLDAIGQVRESVDWLEEDVLEARRQEELRANEWVVEREMSPPLDRDAVMPWSRGGEDDQRFRKSLAISLAISLLLALLVPIIDIPIPDRWEPVEVPERLTRLIEKEPARPPVQPKPRVEEKLAEKSSDVPKPSEPEQAVAEPKPTPQKTASSKGILAFREKFSALAERPANARLGARARIDRSGEAAVGNRGRSLVSTNAPSASGGINVAALSREAVGGNGGELEGVSVGQATSGIAAIAGEERPIGGGPGLSRTDEEIQIVFDRHKAALYRLYNRELRRDPTLAGQMVLRITIEPDGSVSLCEVHSSDMAAPNLSAQVAGRVSHFDFGAKDGIPAITILYPIDFLPAT